MISSGRLRLALLSSLSPSAASDDHDLADGGLGGGHSDLCASQALRGVREGVARRKKLSVPVPARDH
jgi:hypothetical protein